MTNPIKTINDLLALLLLVIIIPGLWIAVSLGKLSMPGEIIGATIAGWTLILQYFYRKKPSGGSK